MPVLLTPLAASINDTRDINTCTELQILLNTFTVSLQAQNSPVPQIFSTIVC